MRPHKRNGIKLTLMLIITIFALASQISSSKALGWSPDVQFTTDANWDFQPSIMQTRDGTIWVFWSSDRVYDQFDIFYKTSSDNGASWSSEKRLTEDSANDNYPSGLQSQDLTIWVAWVSYRTGSQEIFYKTSSNNGTTWTGNVQLTHNYVADSSPSIFQDLHKTIWIVWQRELSPSELAIFYVTSSDNGHSWSSEKRLTNDATLNINLNPSIMGTGNGTIWIAYSSFVNTNYELFYKTSTDYGASWANAMQLTTSTAVDDLAPSVIQDSSGTIWVFWARDEDIYYKTSINNGASWSSDTLLVSTSKGENNPSVTTTTDRKIWLVWDSTRSNSQFDVYYKISDQISPVHDIALTRMIVWLPGGHPVESVPAGTILFINVTVENQGQFAETFNATVYADRNSGGVHVEIETQYDVTLPLGGKKDLKFTWDTASVPYGTYYVSANASIVTGEYDTADNLLFKGARLGGITAPRGYYFASPFVLLAPLALTISAVATLGAIATAFFRFLMSIKPWKPWRRRKTHRNKPRD